MSSRQEPWSPEPASAPGTDTAQIGIRLYVASGQVHSTTALRNLEIALEMSGVGYDLEILDVFEDADWARKDQVLVAPTLIRWTPLPRRRLTGTLQDREAVLRVLGVAPPPRGTH